MNNLFSWKHLLIYIFLILESNYFSRFTKWNLLFNFLNLTGIVNFSSGFMCCLSQVILITFYSALTNESIELMRIEKNISIYYALLIDFFCHMLPFLYWTYYCLKNNVKVKLNEALFTTFLYVIWIRSRSNYSSSYIIKSWDMSHIYVKHNFKIPFTYGLYGSLITREFLNNRKLYILILPFLHILLGQLSNRRYILI